MLKFDVRRVYIMLARSLPLFLLLSGCAAPGKDLEFEGFDPSSVAVMRLQIENIAGSDLQKLSDKQLGSIFAEISQRFTEAGYPLIDNTSYHPGAEPMVSVTNSVKSHVSHVLDVSVGASTLTDTPPGLTFGFGDSDPRSKDFQKALTVPVTCALTALKSSSPPISLTERKAASSEMGTIGLDGSQKLKKLERFFIENIGSTCHNLLSKLGIYPVNPATPEATNRLSPAVRIETEYETAPSTSEQSDRETPVSRGAETARRNRITKPDASGGTTEGARDHQAPGVSNPPKDKNDFEGIAEGQKPPKPSVSAIQDQAKDWRDKKIRIFNQGDTVILKFGNDQR